LLPSRTAIITGSAGFIGKALVQRLRSEDWDVVEVDLIKTESSINPESLIEQIHAGVFKHERTVLFHIGANANATAGHIEDLFHANVDLTNKYFDAASKKNIPTIFMSSAAVYGKGRQSSKLSPYAQSKILGEKILLEKQQSHNWPAIIFRLFNTYGMGEAKKGHMVSIPRKFINSARECQRIEIWKVPEKAIQSRDFIALSDVVSVLFHAATSEAIHCGGIFDLGTGVSTDFSSVADIVTSYFPAKVTQVPFPVTQNLDFYQTYTKAKNLLQLELPPHHQFISVAEGIQSYAREILTGNES
jgi:ADP-L-glycero-D-manno-heptose 6-epimerase